MEVGRFEPPVVYHPGAMLKEKIDEMGITVKEFSIRASMPVNVVYAVIRGYIPITADMAATFEKITGIASYIWIGMQDNYTTDMECEELNIDIIGGEIDFDEQYLNECIERATPKWKDIEDVDEWLREIRGYYE